MHSEAAARASNARECPPTSWDLHGMGQHKASRKLIETKKKPQGKRQTSVGQQQPSLARHTPLGTAHAFPVILVPLLGVGSRELLQTPLALVHRWVIRVRGLVVAVTVVQAGECSAALIALVTDGRRRRGLDGRPRGGSERR